MTRLNDICAWLAVILGTSVAWYDSGQIGYERGVRHAQEALYAATANLKVGNSSTIAPGDTVCWMIKPDDAALPYWHSP